MRDTDFPCIFSSSRHHLFDHTFAVCINSSTLGLLLPLYSCRSCIHLPISIPLSTQDGETALYVAARHGNLPTVMMLLLDGADFTHLNKHGENVMHIITKECHFPLAQNLLHHVIETSSKEAATKLVNQRNKVGIFFLRRFKQRKFDFFDRMESRAFIMRRV